MSNSRLRHMRRNAAMMGVTSRWSNWMAGAVTVPSFRAFVWAYVAMAVLRTVVLVAVAMAGPPVRNSWHGRSVGNGRSDVKENVRRERFSAEGRRHREGPDRRERKDMLNIPATQRQ